MSDTKSQSGYTTNDASVLRKAIDTALKENARIAVTISSPTAPSSAPHPRLPRRPRGGVGIKARGGAGWKQRWLREKLEREGRASPGDQVMVGDGVAARFKAYAHGNVKSKGGHTEYGGEVGIEATC